MKVDIRLIRESFNAVKPHADEFVEHFYEELFTRHPAAKGLFAGTDMKKQRKALAASLVHIVDFWEEQDHLEDYLFKMGARHIKYSTQVEHFPLVAEALLATFEFFFEKQWTDELKAHWVGLYQFIQEHMTRGMQAAWKKKQEREESHLKEVPPLSLDDMARDLAREAFKKALDEEAGAALMELAREKAKEILRKSLESEARELMKSVARKAA